MSVHVHSEYRHSSSVVQPPVRHRQTCANASTISRNGASSQVLAPITLDGWPLAGFDSEHLLVSLWPSARVGRQRTLSAMPRSVIEKNRFGP